MILSFFIYFFELDCVLHTHQIYFSEKKKEKKKEWKHEREKERKKKRL